MCGRFSQDEAIFELLSQFSGLQGVQFSPSYNIAPSQAVVAIRQQEVVPQAAPIQWGLVPAWAKDVRIGYKMINARSETVFEKPSFRAAIKSRRCLVPASGYYEWQKQEGGSKQPFFIHQQNRPFMFAALWERWQKGEAPIESFAILTTVASPILSPIHHRMPVTIAAENFSSWLDPDRPTQDIQSLLNSKTTPNFQAYPVSTFVNNPRNNSPECIKPLSN